MDLNQWYEHAINPDAYIDNMQKNKENLLHIYDHFTPPEEDALIKRLKDKHLRAIVLTEDWCGDAMLNIPVLLRLSEQANIQVRMLLRDQNLELMDQYLTNGKSRSIPIFIFIDEDGNEVAKWGPRAEIVQEYVDESRKKLPPKESDDFDEKAKEMYMFMSKSFRDNPSFWQAVYESIKDALQ
ncbi:thioredoxin family protein [Virgibacillus siamensis]|uniref:thioredoxin family protein n=1 Tax=Virgibacillus siamensis TaxID=480071 RepID=UPI000987A3F6|nr:thioredoxin family protein [Virgibacillus siamensis]